MIKPSRSILLILFGVLSLQLTAQEITMGALLREMTDRESLAKFPEINYSTKQFSSYDRRAEVKGGDHWYANKVRIKGKNPKATNYVFGLDYLKVKK